MMGSKNRKNVRQQTRFCNNIYYFCHVSSANALIFVNYQCLNSRIFCANKFSLNSFYTIEDIFPSAFATSFENQQMAFDHLFIFGI